MRTRQQLMEKFVSSHRHPTNIIVHIICVPLIVFSTLGLAWLVPIGQWLGLPPAWAPYVNLATLAALPIGLFYLRLSAGSLLTMSLWFLLSVAGILALQRIGASLLWVCGVIWVAAWLVQIWGHKVEGAKPSAGDDAIFFLIGPLFVTDLLRRRVGAA